MPDNYMTPTSAALRIVVFVSLLSLLQACSGGSGDVGPSVTVQVAGTVRYQDKQYGSYGFDGVTRYQSVRYAVVDLVASNDEVLASTVTDGDGYYELQGTGPNPRVRVVAQTSAKVGAVVRIADFSGNGYAVTESLGDAGEEVQQVDFDIDADTAIGGAFNMLDVYTSAAQFVSELSTASMPGLNVFWQYQSSQYGTYFCSSAHKYGACPQGRGIYILGGRATGGDSDHYDDDVLLHEFAHYVEGMVGLQDSPGGVHYLTDNDQDLRLTWSEGLGGFFPGAVKAWMAQHQPERLSIAAGMPTSYFVDTYGSYVGISLDVANPNTIFCPWGNDCFVYSSSEIAVAKILLGLMDEFGMQAVWDIYTSHMSAGTTLPATLETFWDGWLLQRSPADQELAAIKAVFNDRLVFYQEDGFESDNQVGGGSFFRKLAVCGDTLCDGEQHYLYQSSLSQDQDMVAFDAAAHQTYFIETLGLSNGADTVIRILDAAGNLVYDENGQAMSNDDRPGTVYCGNYDNPCRIHNDSLMLSSELYFTPATTATYYVEVKTSSSKPASAGRYGTYTLQISAQ